MSAPTGHKYSEEDIFKRINFVVTDSTSHNLEVIGMVEKELQVNEIPKTLSCNVHALMMFQVKMKEICYNIHNSLRNKKFVECFLVDVEFKHESFVIKSLRCLSNFINNDYSCKSWNRSGHFASVIAPKENRLLSLKDNCFNRTVLTVLLYR